MVPTLEPRERLAEGGASSILRNMPVSRTLTSVLTIVGALSCSQTPRVENPEPSGPVIESLTPSEGPAGTAYPIQITLVGTGFAPEGNLVTFGDIPIENLASTQGGTHLTFSAPKERPSTGEVPPFVLVPGEYEVTVTTPSGTSAPVTFEFTRGP